MESLADDYTDDGSMLYKSAFHDMSPEEQVKLLPVELWKDIEIGDKIKVFWHPHELTKHPQNWNSGWACDGTKRFVKCQSGITGFYQTKGLDGWRCQPCDFDLCKKCVQVSFALEDMLNRED